MPPQITVAVATVLGVFLEDPARVRYGYDLMKETGFASGKVYPLLARLRGAGWLTVTEEDVDPAVAGRPARRGYRLTAEGTQVARRELARLDERLRPARDPRGMRPEGGLA
ncbi:PadR family transcriptional regulator [Sphaerisporangium sp. TRM90804]|uniref:PadR family transcriptional regulator n=1 Tax=Sphaerisporangium sp. TRM90804 TaxID=3031113 RepID=UPI00244A3B5A|nr:PadR family transcriptional regulator [Sphaerisporangium sp. TRM90804]MDH2427488.1 PadR family transcriptional regulator [Sphaerisporangium sp. TRM90804]